MRIATLVIASALCASAWSGTRAADRTWGDGTLPESLAVYDVNTNGVLSVEEIQALKDARRGMQGEWLSHWDTNSDGMVDSDERGAARNELRQRIERRRSDRFNEADTDGDGCLTLEEFSAIPAVLELAVAHPDAPAQIHGQLDANHDGCVVLAEFISHLRDHRGEWRTLSVYAAADGNTDACLSQAEFSAIPGVMQVGEEHSEQPAMMYSGLDINHDNCLTIEEFLAPPSGPSATAWRNNATYDEADEDANNCLTRAEFSTIPEVVRIAEQNADAPSMMFRNLDMNHDSCLSLLEFTSPEHEAECDSGRDRDP